MQKLESLGTGNQQKTWNPMRVNLLCTSLIVLAVFVFYSKGLWISLHSIDLTLVFSAWDADNKFYFKAANSVCRPIATMFAALSYKLAGTSALPFTITARIIHCIVSVCAFYLIRQLTRNTLIGLFSALLFASFYVPAQAILEPHAIADAFMALFGMLALISYVRYMETNNTRYVLAVAVSFVMALLSKESAIVLPLLIIIVDYYCRHGRLELKGLLKDAFSPEGARKYGIYVCISLLYIVLLWTLGEGQSFALITRTFRYYGIFHKLYVLVFTIHCTVTPTFIWSVLFTKIYSLGFAVSVLILFFYSEAKVRNLLFFLACSTAILFLPFCLFDVVSRYLYFPAVFSTAFIAASTYYGVGKLFKSRLLDNISTMEQLKKKEVVIPLVFLLACYLSIMYSNYHFISRQIAVVQKASDLIESNVRDISAFLAKESGKCDLYLLNFPNTLQEVFSLSPIIVWGFYIEDDNVRKELDLYLDTGESVDNVFHYKIRLGAAYKYGVAGEGEISIIEFDALAKNKSNKVLLFDQTREKVFDVSGKDYASVRMLISRP